MTVTWVERKVEVQMISGTSTRLAWVANDVLAVTRNNDRGGIGWHFTITHLPTGLHFGKASGVYRSIHDAKRCAEILLPLQNDWNFTSDEVHADPDRAEYLRQLIRSAVLQEFGEEPLELAKNVERPIQTPNAVRLNGFGATS